MAMCTGCRQQASRPKLSIDEIRSITAKFESVTNAYLNAWNMHDTEQMREQFTENARYFEEGNAANESNVDTMLDFYKNLFISNPDIQGYHIDTYIARKDGFDVWESWPANGSMFTKENPIRAYDWYTLSDAKISRLWVLWGDKTLKTVHLEFNPQPLVDYASAWSSGDPQAVAALYSEDTIREDTLFGEKQQGSTAINEFSSDFFSWYPAVKLELRQAFGLESKDIRMTGGEYSIHVSDPVGSPCEVKAIILLQMANEKITSETVFYNPDSLIACGWAQ